MDMDIFFCDPTIFLISLGERKKKINCQKFSFQIPQHCFQVKYMQFQASFQTIGQDV